MLQSIDDGILLPDVSRQRSLCQHAFENPGVGEDFLLTSLRVCVSVRSECKDPANINIYCSFQWVSSSEIFIFLVGE